MYVYSWLCYLSPGRHNGKCTQCLVLKMYNVYATFCTLEVCAGHVFFKSSKIGTNALVWILLYNVIGPQIL